MPSSCPTENVAMKIFFHLGSFKDSIISYATAEQEKEALNSAGIDNSPLLCSLWAELLQHKDIALNKEMLLEEREQRGQASILLAHYPSFCQETSLLPRLCQAIAEAMPEAELYAFFALAPQQECRRAHIFWRTFRGMNIDSMLKDIKYKALYDYYAGIKVIEKNFSSGNFHIHAPAGATEGEAAPLSAFFSYIEKITHTPAPKGISPSVRFAVPAQYIQIRNAYALLSPDETTQGIWEWHDASLRCDTATPFPVFLTPEDKKRFLRNYERGNQELEKKFAIQFPASEHDATDTGAFPPPTRQSLSFVSGLPLITEKLDTALQHCDPTRLEIPARKVISAALPEEILRARPTLYPSPDVRVCVLTLAYNHEKYIKEAIESVLRQQTTFPFVHIIADDGSQDGTQDIIREYARKYPQTIIAHLQEGRTFGSKNLKELFSLAPSPYVALCDGDDYFTDPLKLQKQVDFLDAHPDCSICFHPVDVIYEDGRPSRIYPTEEQLPKRKSGIYVLRDLFNCNFIQTNSVMYRWRFREGLPEWFKSNLEPGDWYWHLLHAEVGNIGFLPERMSVYRRHAASLFASAEEDHIKHRYEHGMFELRLYDEVEKHFKGKFHAQLSRLATGVFSDFAMLSIKKGDSKLLKESIDKYPVFGREFMSRLTEHLANQR